MVLVLYEELWLKYVTCMSKRLIRSSSEIRKNSPLRNFGPRQVRVKLFSLQYSLLQRVNVLRLHTMSSNHVTSGTGKRWHEHLTIDLIARVVSNSILHPFVAWLVPLCLRAVQAPYESTQFVASCLYAGAITIVWMLSVINKRVAYGIPRPVDWNEEVVVITGGANGLGKIIAETYGMRGASVAVLDVASPEKESEGLAGIQYYQCDVGDAAAVESAARKIEKDV